MTLLTIFDNVIIMIKNGINNTNNKCNIQKYNEYTNKNKNSNKMCNTTGQFYAKPTEVALVHFYRVTPTGATNEEITLSIAPTPIHKKP